MAHITLDRQAATETCEHCGQQYDVSRGSVYDDGEPFGLYVAGMHGCAEDRFVVLAIAVIGAEGEPPSAVSLRAWSTETEVQMNVLDPGDSPWRNHGYLGEMLTREQALASPLIDTFYHVADHVLRENPEVHEYLEGSEPSKEESVSSNEEPAEAQPVHCSFCGKSLREVRKIIAGPAVTKFAAPGLGCDACRQRYLAEGRTEFPNVYICDECVGLCNTIIEEEVVAQEREEAGGDGGGEEPEGEGDEDEDEDEKA